MKIEITPVFYYCGFGISISNFFKRGGIFCHKEFFLNFHIISPKSTILFQFMGRKKKLWRTSQDDMPDEGPLEGHSEV